MDDDREIQHLRELLDQRFVFLDKALQLQAKENERRLDNLNNENGRILAIQSRCVQQDVYDVELRNIHHKLDDLASLQSNMTGRMTVVNALVTIGVSVTVTVLLGVLLK